MKKTLVSLLLVLVMVLGMFAGTGAVAEDVGYPEEITIFTGLTEHLSKIGITNYNETVFWQELEKRTGTHVEFEHLAAGADMMAQVNLMVASNDLPDIINGVNWKTVPDGANIWEEDGVIIDLTELIPVYMPNYYAAIMELPFSVAELSIGGKMYYISDIQHGVPFEGPNIREDWLKAAGLETPTTVDELYEVLVYFRDNDMNGDGDPSNEWPMSGLGATSIGWSPLNLMWAWGVHYSYQLVDGQVTHGMLLPEFAEAIGTVAKFYAEGLLDPDYATQDRTALDGKYMNNYVGMEYGIQPTKMNKALNPDAVEGGFKAGSVPNLKLTEDSPSYVFDTMYISLLKGASAAITGACEEPEKVLHWFDYIYSPEGSLLFNWGIEGESFAYDENGKPYRDMTGALEKYPDIDPNSLPYMYDIIGTSAFPINMDYDRFATSMHPFSVEAAKGWSADYDTSRLLPAVALSAEAQEELTDVIADLETYIAIELDKLVNGQTPLEEIPNIQAKLIEMGIEDVIAAYQEAYDAYTAG